MRMGAERARRKRLWNGGIVQPIWRRWRQEGEGWNTGPRRGGPWRLERQVVGIGGEQIGAAAVETRTFPYMAWETWRTVLLKGHIGKT
jgi:hypothetical protein